MASVGDPQFPQKQDLPQIPSKKSNLPVLNCLGKVVRRLPGEVFGILQLFAVLSHSLLFL